MADERNNVALDHLREILGKLEEQDRRFDRIDRRLAQIDKTLEELRHQHIYALGLRTASHVRGIGPDSGPVDLDAKCQQLEEIIAKLKMGPALPPRPGA